MFEVDGTEILYNGLAWCPWLTCMLTPAMLKDLVTELNEATEEAEDNGWESGHCDGYDEGYNDGYDFEKDDAD